MIRRAVAQMRLRGASDPERLWKRRFHSTARHVSGVGVMLVAVMLYSCGTGVPLRITADQLTREFANDYATATARYNGKLLVVTGPATFVDRIPSAAQYITMQIHVPGAALPYQVLCGFLDYRLKDRAMQLVEGETITVKGRCRGPMSPLSIVISLEDCRLLD